MSAAVLDRPAEKRARDRAFETWVARARAVTIADDLVRTGHLGRLRKTSRELVGPCPLCGGKDRFGVNPAKNRWNCRKCGKGGRDAISLARHCFGLGFVEACEAVLGEPRPAHVESEAPAVRAARQAEHARVLAEAQAASEAAEQASNEWRDREIRRAREIWRSTRPIAGTPAEAYLFKRGITHAPCDERLGFLRDHALWSAPPPDGHVIHRGPALVQAFEDSNGELCAIEAVWIDIEHPKGKVMIPDPNDPDEMIPAKKYRGSKRGGSVLLGRPLNGLPPDELFIGEGLETVLSVREAILTGRDDQAAAILQTAEWRCAGDLDNLGGKAAGKIAHPTRTVTDKRGRTRHAMVPNGTCDPKDLSAVIAVPPSVADIVLLGDGDSDPFDTRLALERAAQRFNAAYPWVTVHLRMAPAGLDFNDVWMAMAERNDCADKLPSRT